MDLLRQGTLRVALQFLPDLTVVCPECRGRRFNRPTLDVTFRGKSIADVLDMTVADALSLFASIPAIARKVVVFTAPLGPTSPRISPGATEKVIPSAATVWP